MAIAGWGSSAGQRELEAFVSGDEAETLVEAVSVDSRLVAAQLDEGAPTATRLLGRPLEQRHPQSAAAEVTPDPDRLDLGPQRRATRKSGQKVNCIVATTFAPSVATSSRCAGSASITWNAAR